MELFTEQTSGQQTLEQKSNNKIFLSIGDSDDQELTSGFLSKFYPITTDLKSLEKQAVDLIITDQYMIEEQKSMIRFFQQKNPDYAPPVLLLCHSEIRDIPEELLQVTDDLLPIPTSRDVFRTRIEVLLRKREHALKSHENQYYSQLFENNDWPIFRLDESGHLIEANSIAAQMMEAGIAELKGLHFTEFIPGGQKHHLQQTFKKALNHQKQETEGEVLDFHGNRLSKSFMFVPVQVGHSPENIYLVVRDVSRQKEAEHQSRQNRKLLQLIAEKSEMIFFVKDLQKRYYYVNSQWKKLFGKEGKKVVEKTPRELFSDPVILEPMEETDDWVIKHQKERVDELNIMGRYFLVHKLPLNEVPGLEGTMGCMATDITSIKNAEKRRQKQQETLTYLATDKDFADASLNEKLAIIADASQKALKVDQVCIRNLNNDCASCAVECYVEESQEHFITNQPLEENEYPDFFDKIKRREAVIKSDVTLSSEKDDALSLKMGYKAYMTNVVKLYGHQPVGFITFFSREAEEWEDDEKMFGEAISDQIAKAFANEEKQKYQANLEKSLNEKEVLLKEIHHRVKNNMAVVSSLLQMQAMTEKDEQFQAKLMNNVNRVQAMGNIHEQLYKTSSFSEVDMAPQLKNLTQNILTSFSSENTIETKFDCDPIKLDITKAIPFSLLCNEVITNSVKHAFKDRDDGVLSITLRENNGEIYCKIADNGPGLNHEEEKSYSMGMNIIEGLIEQIDGAHKYHSENRGTSFELRFMKEE